MKFPIKDFFSKTADLVTFTEEILNGKLQFLCGVSTKPQLSNGIDRNWHFLNMERFLLILSKRK